MSVIWIIEFGGWEWVQRRVYREWCRRMEGIAGEQESAADGLYKISLQSM